MRERLKQLISYLRSFLPSKLPRGKTELEDFSRSVLKTYGLPDLPSYHHAVSTMILHLGPLEINKSKRHFARSIMKAQANEAAFQKIQEIKELEKKNKELEIEPKSDSDSNGAH